MTQSPISLLHETRARRAAQDDAGATPLSLACDNGYLELAEWLVEVRGNVRSPRPRNVPSLTAEGPPVERGASINVNAIGEMALLARLMLKGGHAPENIAQLALGLQKRPSMQKRATTMARARLGRASPGRGGGAVAREESRWRTHAGRTVRSSSSKTPRELGNATGGALFNAEYKWMR